MDYPRRILLQRSVAVGAGALAAAALPARAADAPGDILFAQPGAFIPVAGTQQRFQVRRIYCVGRNYAAHAIERGSDPHASHRFSSRSRQMRSRRSRKA